MRDDSGNLNYTTDFYGTGKPARPSARFSAWGFRTEELPYVLGPGKVRGLARKVARLIAEDARNLHGPVVWITGNSMLPPMREILDAERVYQAENNRDGELFEWFGEMVRDNLAAQDVALECPDYDNALYAVDLRRWQYREDGPEDPDSADINDEWEPRDPDAADDSRDNPRE